MRSETTPKPSDADVRRGYITKALQHYRLMDFHMKQATPGFSLSGWQEQFLDAIAHLADKVEEHIEREMNEEKNDG